MDRSNRMKANIYMLTQLRREILSFRLVDSEVQNMDSTYQNKSKTDKNLFQEERLTISSWGLVHCS